MIKKFFSLHWIRTYEFFFAFAVCCYDYFAYNMWAVISDQMYFILHSSVVAAYILLAAYLAENPIKVERTRKQVGSLMFSMFGFALVDVFKQIAMDYTSSFFEHLGIVVFFIIAVGKYYGWYRLWKRFDGGYH